MDRQNNRFFRWEKGVEIQIEIPQIEIPSDIILLDSKKF